MLVLLRLIFGFALFSVLARAVRLAEENPQTDGTSDAGYVALSVILGIANAIVWAPLVGRLLADPLTGAFTTGHPAEYRNYVVQFVNKLAARRWRRLALFFAFLEGVRHPDLPAAFVLGMNNARPGSFLERIFAREVWRFDNAENCLRAWEILHARGENLRIHRRPEVNLLVLSIQRESSPAPDPLNLPPAPRPPAPVRNPRIRLFEGSPAGSPSGKGESPVATAGEAGAAAGAGEIRQSAGARRPGETLSLIDRLRILLTGRLPDQRD
jgi:hypothetical protein